MALTASIVSFLLGEMQQLQVYCHIDRNSQTEKYYQNWSHNFYVLFSCVSFAVANSRRCTALQVRP